MEKSVLDHTLEEYRNMENFLDKSVKYFDSFIVVPMDYTYDDTSYRCMKYILVNAHENKIVGVLGGNSDVIELNGIGGYGLGPINETIKSGLVKRTDWSIDCLDASGCLRFFVHKDWLCLGPSSLPVGSTFEIYSTEDRL